MKQLDLDIYRKMFLIRTAELAIQKHYPSDEMKTPMHMSMGEEAIVAGVCHALEEVDQVFGTYRSHALFLAKTSDANSFFAEMYGRETGVARGRAGSMHLCLPEKGVMCCSAIVASSIPTAVGAAFANKRLKNGKRTAVFFGDGATDEGAFWESLNVACLMKLPVLFVCEDNGIAVHTVRGNRQGFERLEDVVSNFRCHVHFSDSTDASVIYEITLKTLEEMKHTKRPALLRLNYYRYLEHVGINEDFKDNYRPMEEYETWLAKDPLLIMRTRIKAQPGGDDELAALEEKVQKYVDRAVRFAKESRFVDCEDAFEGVYQCE